MSPLRHVPRVGPARRASFKYCSVAIPCMQIAVLNYFLLLTQEESSGSEQGCVTCRSAGLFFGVNEVEFYTGVPPAALLLAGTRLARVIKFNPATSEACDALCTVFDALIGSNKIHNVATPSVRTKAHAANHALSGVLAATGNWVATHGCWSDDSN
jgi:hypothetical protein